MLKGLGDLSKMGNVVKQAMEMKEKMEQVKASLGNERIEASAGGGMVCVEMNGNMEVLSVKIDPEIADPEEIEMLETLVQAGMNEAVRKTREMVEEKMKEVAGGINIPGLTT
jgi:nucleoid-associated protein EbfC